MRVLMKPSKAGATVIGSLTVAAFLLWGGDLNAQTSSAPAPPPAKIDLKKLDRLYADPGSPNISGVWRAVRDTYRPRLVSDNVRASSGGAPNDGGGLPPGVLPRNFWIVDNEPLPGRGPGGPWVGIPYTPEWQKIYDARVTSNRAGKTYGDPFLECLPRGAMAVYNHAGDLPFSITQTPGRVRQIFEEHNYLRDIYADGRKHAAWADVNNDDYDPTPFGHSIGHWEGKTFVVDTIGIAKQYTMGYFAPHSDVFHMVERFTRIDDMHLDLDIFVEDKKALAKPMTMKIRYRLQPNEGDFKEDVCNDSRHGTDANGYMQTLVKPKRQAGWDLPD